MRDGGGGEGKEGRGGGRVYIGGGWRWEEEY